MQALDYALAQFGGRLLVRIGDPARVVPETVAKLGVDTVYWNADVTPFAVGPRSPGHRAASPSPVETSWGSLVHPPGSVLTAKGTLSRVFTPFYKAWKAAPVGSVAGARATPRCSTTRASPCRPSTDPPPMFEGESEAKLRLEQFLERVDQYDVDRDRPDRRRHLAAVGRPAVRHPVAPHGRRRGRRGDRRAGRCSCASSPGATGTPTCWSSCPSLPKRSMRERFDQIEWRNDPAEIAAWKGGYTGFPIVDAGMRQLRETGWMHNRVRMIVGSFLVKDLLVDWRIGERHFRHLLVDGDVPQNVGNWQWVAGTGPDASPYHRIFNPVTQSRKFDPTGAYIRRWVPELAALDDKAIHAPWEVAPLDLAGRRHHARRRLPRAARRPRRGPRRAPWPPTPRSATPRRSRCLGAAPRNSITRSDRAPQPMRAPPIRTRRPTAHSADQDAAAQDGRPACTVDACCTERRLIERGG